MTLLATTQRDTVLRVWRDTDTFSRDLVALVMGVPDEDRSAFSEWLHDWLHWIAEQDEDWDFDPTADPLPSDALEAFWQEHSPRAEYFGSDLESEVLAERARRARNLDELSRVLERVSGHIGQRSNDPVGNFRGFFTCLSDALAHPDFEQVASLDPALRAVA